MDKDIMETVLTEILEEQKKRSHEKRHPVNLNTE